MVQLRSDLFNYLQGGKGVWLVTLIRTTSRISAACCCITRSLSCLTHFVLGSIMHYNLMNVVNWGDMIHCLGLFKGLFHLLSMKLMCLKVLASRENVDAGPFSYQVFRSCSGEKMEHFWHLLILMTKVLNRKKSPGEQNKPFGLPFQDVK